MFGGGVEVLGGFGCCVDGFHCFSCRFLGLGTGW